MHEPETLYIEAVRSNPQLRLDCIARRAHLYYRGELVYGIKDMPARRYRLRFWDGATVVVGRKAVLELVRTAELA